MYYKKNKGSSSGAGCDSRPVVIVHDLLDFQVAESVKFRYRQYSLDKEDRAYLTTLDQITLTLFSLENRVFSFGEKRQKVR